MPLDLFEGYGLPVEHSLGAAAVAIAGPSVMAVIGYAAPTVRGRLASLDLASSGRGASARGVRMDIASEASLRDVLGEFCNMLSVG